MYSTFARRPPLIKRREDWRVVPNLVDYDQTRKGFSWQAARGLLDGLPDGRGLNIAHEAVDRHVSKGKGARVAFRWIARSNRTRDITYAELSALTNRFANALQRLGVGKGDVVVALAGRIPELYIAALGSLKTGAIFSPLFSAFGPEPIKARMNIAHARVLVTTEALYRRKVEPNRSAMPALEHVLLVGEPSAATHLPATQDFQTLLDQSAAAFTIPPTEEGDPALLHFTSGTTGQPKGALHVHEAVVAHHITGRFALDLHPEDIFWCTADPGWVTGTSYGIVASLPTASPASLMKATSMQNAGTVSCETSGSVCGTRRRPQSA
jgi:acetyl-CoA synthetase